MKYFFAVLVIVFGELPMITQVHASTLHNYQTGLCLAVIPKYTLPNGKLPSSIGLGSFDGEPLSYLGAPIIVWTCDGTASQQWHQIFYWYDSGTNSYMTSDSPPDDSYHASFYLINDLPPVTQDSKALYVYSVIGVQAGVIKNGTSLIEWYETSDLNQQWRGVPVGSDANGHPCYIIKNAASSGSGQPYVMGVLGGNRNKGAQVVIWQLFVDAYGNPDLRGHPDQSWCVY